MIDVKICTSEKLNKVSSGAEMLWTRLLTNLDDNGNYDRDALVVYATCLRFKAGVSIEQVEGWLKELIEVRSDGEHGLLTEYECKGREYIHLTNFHDNQNLRDDKVRTVDYPIHPEEFEEKGYIKTGIGKSVDRTHTAHVPPIDRPRPVPKQSTSGHQDRSEVEVEVEVKESKYEVEGEVPTNYLPLDSKNKIELFPMFAKEFRAVAGVRLKPFPKLVEAYESAVSRYGWDLLCQALGEWVKEEGGRDVVRKHKRKDFAANNFLEALDEVIEEIKAAPVVDEPEEISRVSAPSSVVRDDL